MGHAELSRVDRRNRSASISRLLVGEPSARGKGIGRQIVSRLLDVAFGEMSLHRVDLYVLEFHVDALSTYKGLGFKTEGHLVEARRAGGRYWNAYYMAMLRRSGSAATPGDPRPARPGGPSISGRPVLTRSGRCRLLAAAHAVRAIRGSAPWGTGSSSRLVAGTPQGGCTASS